MYFDATDAHQSAFGADAAGVQRGDVGCPQSRGMGLSDTAAVSAPVLVFLTVKLVAVEVGAPFWWSPRISVPPDRPHTLHRAIQSLIKVQTLLLIISVVDVWVSNRDGGWIIFIDLNGSIPVTFAISHWVAPTSHWMLLVSRDIGACRPGLLTFQFPHFMLSYTLKPDIFSMSLLLFIVLM